MAASMRALWNLKKSLFACVRCQLFERLFEPNSSKSAHLEHEREEQQHYVLGLVQLGQMWLRKFVVTSYFIL